MSESESGECESVEEIASAVALPEHDDEDCSQNPSRPETKANAEEDDDELSEESEEGGGKGDLDPEFAADE